MFEKAFSGFWGIDGFYSNSCVVAGQHTTYLPLTYNAQKWGFVYKALREAYGFQ